MNTNTNSGKNESKYFDPYQLFGDGVEDDDAVNAGAERGGYVVRDGGEEVFKVYKSRVVFS